MELDPFNPLIQVWYAVLLIDNGDFQEALLYGENITANSPEHVMANTLIEISAFYCKDYDKVVAASKYVLAHTDVNFEEVDGIYWEAGFVAAYEEILRQLEFLAVEDYIQPIELIYRYIMVDQLDKAMDWIEKGYELRDQVMPYMGTKGFLCEPLFDNPRFIEILQRIGFYEIWHPWGSGGGSKVN